MVHLSSLNLPEISVTRPATYGPGTATRWSSASRISHGIQLGEILFVDLPMRALPSSR